MDPLPLLPVTTGQVRRQLETLHQSKAAGPDGISPEILKTDATSSTWPRRRWPHCGRPPVWFYPGPSACAAGGWTFSVSLLLLVHGSMLSSAGEAASEEATPPDWRNWSGRPAQWGDNWTLLKLWWRGGCWTNCYLFQITLTTLSSCYWTGSGAPSGIGRLRSAATRTDRRNLFWWVH